MKAASLKIFTLWSLFLMMSEVRAESEIPLAAIEIDMREKISLLGSGNSFVYVDLGLTQEELNLIEKLKFDLLAPTDAAVEYNRYGNLHLIKEELPNFLRKIGNNAEDVVQAITEIITRTAYQVTRAANKNSAWISVRAFTPTHEFDMPRWHWDGKFYGFKDNVSDEIIYKFAAVLKGSPTLLYKLPSDMRGVFNSNARDRAFLSAWLDRAKAESAKKGEGIFFIVVDPLLGAIHSEPKISENRLFFSILIGDEAEINELYARWHSKP